MNTTSKARCIFTLILFTSTVCQAWYSGEPIISRGGYNNTIENFSEDAVYCGSNDCGNLNITTVPNTGYRNRRVANECPLWLRRYIIDPIRGALRTNFD